MANKRLLEQEEVNRIVVARLKRERERLTREFEVRLKRCMAAVHLTLYQEMCALKQEIAAETTDPLWSDALSNTRSGTPTEAHSENKGGEIS
jgi:hypothetical protein